MRLVPALFAIAAAATAASTDTVPPELAVIGEPSAVLNVTYSVHHPNLASSLAISSTQPSTYSNWLEVPDSSLLGCTTAAPA
ncbi:hypothetical protein N7527_008571 [Penicillium freii]|nr:hypothetical protein N7527_008571 [Penicillium freii]